MAEYATSESWAVDDMKPDLNIHIFEKEGNDYHDLTNAVNFKFYLRNMATGVLKLDADENGMSIVTAATGHMKREWQTDDTDTAGRYLAWVTFEDGSSNVTTVRPVEVLIEDAWNRSFV